VGPKPGPTVTSLAQGVSRAPSGALFQRFVDGVGGIALLLLDPDGVIASWNEGAVRLHGFEASEVLGRHFRELFPPDEDSRRCADDHLNRARATGSSRSEPWLLRKDGRRVWTILSVTSISPRDGFGVVVRDLTARLRRDALLEGQRDVLGLVAGKAPLTEVLGELVRVTERQTDGMPCAIMLSDREDGVLRFGAAQGLPWELIATFDGSKAGPLSGSSAAAAYLRQPVFAADTLTAACWAQHRDVVSRFGLRACWAMPILGDDDSVLGTFEMYSHEPGEPSPWHAGIIEASCQLARVAILARRAEEELRSSEELLRTVFDSAPFGIALRTLDGRHARVNPCYQRLLGYTETDPSAPTPEAVAHGQEPDGWTEMATALDGGSARHFVREKRFDRGDGESISVRVTVALVPGPDGKPACQIALAEDVTDRKRAEAALRESAEELKALSQRLVEVQEQERRRLARNLHDSVGQNLTALSINLDILKSQLAAEPDVRVRNRLDDSSALIESTVDTIESTMAELRPPMLDDHGLLHALRWYARRFAARSGIAVNVRGDNLAIRPGPEVEIALFRIAQEALTNVAKHARARRVDVDLRLLPGALTLSLADDGVGFDSKRQAGSGRGYHLGMITMAERAQAAGGRFEVHTAPGQGTRVIVQVPNRHADPRTDR